MPIKLVVQPNGFLSRFSTIVDDFTYLNMTYEEAAHVEIDRAMDEARRNVEAAIKKAEGEP